LPKRDGSVFTPYSEAMMSDERSKTPPDSAAVAETPLIYLVDDEPLLLELAEMVLEVDGYRMEKFLDPAKAWESFSKADRRPDLLVTDYAMSSMTGAELILKCKAMMPELRTILISGTEDEGILKTIPVQVDYFLRKPYRTVELSEVVRTMLRKG